MSRINLLPWREELRKEKQREFLVVAAGSAIVMLGIVLLVHLQINGRIDEQQSRNNFLQKEIKKVEAQIEEIQDLEKQKKQLIARMKIIERLQSNRPEVVHLFDELVKATPEGLYLTNLKQQGSKLTVQGSAQSNARVSAFMRNLDASPWFEQPLLEVIQASAKGMDRSRTFTLTVNQPHSEKEAKE